MAFDADKGMAKRTVRQYCSLWNELRYDEIHNKPYFIGKKDKDSITEILFPVDCTKSFTFDELKSYIVDSGSTAVNLAVYNTDSTVVLYKAELGLKPPALLEENSSSSVLDNSSVTLQPSASTKKRKIGSDSPKSNQSETGSISECLQIDLHSADSDFSIVNRKDSDDSNTYSEDN